MPTLEGCFGILGVDPDSSADEVKKAYRELVREWHPDKLAHDSKQQKVAEERLKEINLAYSYVQTYFEASSAVRKRPAKSRPERPPDGQTRTSAYKTYGGVDPNEDDEPDVESSYVRATRLFSEGMELYKRGAFRESISPLVQSVCLQPNNFDAQLMLGNAYMKIKNPAKAATAFKQVIRFRPNLIESHIQLAQAYIQMGDMKEAVWHCTQCLKRFADSPELFVTLAEAYRKQNRIPQAKQALAEALSLAPNLLQAQFEMGLVHVACGEKEAARKIYDGLRRSDEDLAVRLLLAILDR